MPVLRGLKMELETGVQDTLMYRSYIVEGETGGVNVLVTGWK